MATGKTTTKKTVAKVKATPKATKSTATPKKARARKTPAPVATSKRIKLLEDIGGFAAGSVVTKNPGSMAHHVKTGRAEYTKDDYITIRVERS